MSEIEQLRARVAELEAANEALQFRMNELVGSPDDGHVIVPGMGEVRLQPQQALLFRLLLAHRGRMVSKEALYQSIVGHRPDCDWPGPKQVDVQLHRVRRAIRGSSVLIESIWGRGYRLVDVTRTEVGLPLRTPDGASP